MPQAFNEFECFFHNLNLSKYETKAYLALLKHGPQDHKGLMKLSDDNGRIKSTLKSLIKKGWIKIIGINPRIFCAVYPEKPLRRYLLNMKKFYRLVMPF